MKKKPKYWWENAKVEACTAPIKVRKMNDSEYVYNDGDIVWVKLGSCWWPGEVKDLNSLPSEVLEFKKTPLVIVKFFDEDSYEYVRSWSNIYPYNSDRKDEFIKKGMGAFRAKISHMEKFPVDVSSAEVKTGGNPNLLSDPKFLPEKKINYIAEIFGTSSPKRAHRDSDSARKKGRSSNARSDNDTSHITHRRFLGYDDYQAFICIQYPGKDKDGDSGDEEVRLINEEPEKIFNCHSCTFKTKRLEVMILHNKSHIQGVYVSSSKKPVSKVSESVAESALLDKSSPKRKKKPAPKKSRQKKKEKTTEKPVTDIRNDILAEWEDSEEEELSSSKNNTLEESSLEAEISSVDAAPPKITEPKNDNQETGENKENEERKKSEEPKASIDKDTQEGIRSCFDFNEDDEEEEEIISTPASTGRKIPRVIPEKRRSLEDSPLKVQEEHTDDQPEVDDINRDEILKTSESFSKREETHDEIELAFKDLMESTAVPELPEIGNELKPEQNFRDGGTIKFPDKPAVQEMTAMKDEKKETEVATKLTNPKKRFVKSFEDFELEMRRKEEESEAKAKTDDKLIESNLISEDNAIISNEEKGDVVSESTTLADKLTKPVEASEQSLSSGRHKSSHRTPRSKILESYREENRRKSEDLLSHGDEMLARNEEKIEPTRVNDRVQQLCGNSESSSESTKKLEDLLPQSHETPTKEDKVETTEIQDKLQQLFGNFDNSSERKKSYDLLSHNDEIPMSQEDKTENTQIKDKLQQLFGDFDNSSESTKKSEDLFSLRCETTTIKENKIETIQIKDKPYDNFDSQTESIRKLEDLLSQNDETPASNEEKIEPVQIKDRFQQLYGNYFDSSQEESRRIWEGLPPKKSKWSRRGSHPKKYKRTMIEESGEEPFSIKDTTLGNLSFSRDAENSSIKMTVQCSDKNSSSVICSVPNTISADVIGKTCASRNDESISSVLDEEGGLMTTGAFCSTPNTDSNIPEVSSENFVSLTENKSVSPKSNAESSGVFCSFSSTKEDFAEEKLTDNGDGKQNQDTLLPENRNIKEFDIPKLPVEDKRKAASYEENDCVFSDASDDSEIFSLSKFRILEESNEDKSVDESCDSAQDRQSNVTEHYFSGLPKAAVQVAADIVPAESKPSEILCLEQKKLELSEECMDSQTPLQQEKLEDVIEYEGIKEDSIASIANTENDEIETIKECSDLQSTPQIREEMSVAKSCRKGIGGLEINLEEIVSEPYDKYTKDKSNLLQNPSETIEGKIAHDESSNIQTPSTPQELGEKQFNQEERKVQVPVMLEEAVQKELVQEESNIQAPLAPEETSEKVLIQEESKIQAPLTPEETVEKVQEERHNQTPLSAEKTIEKIQEEQRDQTPPDETVEKIQEERKNQTPPTQERTVDKIEEERNNQTPLTPEETVEKEFVQKENSNIQTTSAQEKPIKSKLVQDEKCNIRELSTPEKELPEGGNSTLECLFEAHLYSKNDLSQESILQNATVTIKASETSQLDPSLEVIPKEVLVPSETKDINMLPSLLAKDDNCTSMSDEAKKSEGIETVVEENKLSSPKAEKEISENEKNKIREQLEIPIENQDSFSSHREEITEEMSVMDSFMSPSKDEFSTIGSASLELPEDAICSPPKKKNKRKKRDYELEKNIQHSLEEKQTDLDSFFRNLERKRKKKKELLPSHVEDSFNNENKETMTVENKETPSEIKTDLKGRGINKDGEVLDDGILTKEVVPSEDNKTGDEDSFQETTSTSDHKIEMEIKCANNGEEEEEFKFSIQTNLTNFTKAEELSALTLAALSEIKADKLSENEESQETNSKEAEKSTDHKEETNTLPVNIPLPNESELVQIEGNLTVVSEKDLADGQVEITSEKIISQKKPVTISSFSMDFSESSAGSSQLKSEEASPKNNGTEFTAKAITSEIEKPRNKNKPNAYERLELLDILEGNSDSNQKFKESFNAYNKKDIVQGICDFEECIPSQIVCAKPKNKEEEDVKSTKEEAKKENTSSKLLEKLTEPKSNKPKINIQSDVKVSENVTKLLNKTNKTNVSPRNVSKYIIKTTKAAPNDTPSGSKPIIISEQIIKPANTTPKTSLKRSFEDIEDVEAFIIPKGAKKIVLDNEETLKTLGTEEKPGKATIKWKKPLAKASGKAKILQQTIITPEGEIIQPNITSVHADDNVFDINSMPIVLSDAILTPESIEKMPIVIGSDAAVATNKDKMVSVKRPIVPSLTQIKTAVTTAIKPSTSTVKAGKPRILQTPTKTLTKPSSSPILPNMTKTAKYIIVPSNPTTSLPQGKLITTSKPMLVKRTSPTTKLTGVVTPEAVGNKVMIVTNQQGQQQRLLLTPAQQKMLGYQTQAAKLAKTIVKGGVLSKTIVPEPGPSGLVLSKPTGILTQKPIEQPKGTRQINKRPISQARSGHKPQKTILIKNQHGQTVRKIQGTDDEELDKQVAEQLEAIKASARLSAQNKQPEVLNYRQTSKTPVRRSYAKKVEPSKAKMTVTLPKPEPALPLLAPISPSKKVIETEVQPKVTESTKLAIKPQEFKPDRPLNQLVIQDAMGNQTTITEGQILALPSETVDGQPQSYMLVTLDESGNLTPLNNEALMSLDPSLGLGGDINNMVLQIDQGQAALTIPAKDAAAETKSTENKLVIQQKLPEPEKTIVPEAIVETEVIQEKKPLEKQLVIPQTMPSDPAIGGQQLIVTGDPIATQKFLESLTEGTTDLANILANAEGSSILIQADGQQILINTNSDNQMLLSVNNNGLNVGESTEADGNPIFATQPNKNQDILAAALADTDVFQQEQHTTQTKIQSQLSPNSTLYPMTVGNVLETSLTLSSPIMTPLEVPSTNNKKIDDEADILNQVPKNVDLPITITDPNISQTVAQQQASLLANDLPTMELTLPISEATISVTASEMNSPSYAYSLPTLDETVDITHKSFNSSMPLLTEDVVEEATIVTSKTDVSKPEDGAEENTKHLDEFQVHMEGMGIEGEECNVRNVKPGGSFIEDEGLCTLGSEMCSSLSEPPPDMFDLPGAGFIPKQNEGSNLEKDEEISSDLSSAQAETSSFNSDASCEIPVQSQIVAKLSELKRSSEDGDDSESKKCKFD